MFIKVTIVVDFYTLFSIDLQNLVSKQLKGFVLDLGFNVLLSPLSIEFGKLPAKSNTRSIIIHLDPATTINLLPNTT